MVLKGHGVHQLQRGLEVELSEEPGDDRLVRLYVQRAAQGGGLGPLVYLAELRGGDKTFVYTSHLQEGRGSVLLSPKGAGSMPPTTTGATSIKPTSWMSLG